MGRADRKRRSRSSGGGAPPTHTSNAKANRWQTELNEALEILDAWDDAADEELAAVYMQLESILWKREEATMVSERQAKKGPAASEADSSVADVPWDRVVGVFDKGCRHEKVGVRCSAWEAAVDCCLVEPQLREALEDSDFHRFAWMQLGTAATADALPPSSLLATLFAFLQMTTEASEAAVAAVGSEDLAAVVALASRVPVHHNCAAAALELLLVLSDPTVIEDAGGEDLPTHASGGGGHAASSSSAAAAAAPSAPFGSAAVSVGESLAALPSWAALMSTTLDASRSASAPPPTSAAASSFAAANSTSSAEGHALSHRVLAAALVLNVSASVAAAAATATVSLGELRLRAVRALRAAVAQAATAAEAAAVAATSTDASTSANVDASAGAPMPVPSTMRTALEALCNVLVVDGRAEGEEGDCEEAPESVVEPSIAAALSPAELLIDLLSVLNAYMPAGGAGGARASGGGGGDDTGSDGVAVRILRCAGALLSSSPAVFSHAALADAAAAVWEAAARAARHLLSASAETQLELLQVLSLLCARCAADDDDAEPIALPIDAVAQLSKAALPWPHALTRSRGTAAAAVGLLGQLLGLLRAAAPCAALRHDLMMHLASWAAPWVHGSAKASAGWEGAACAVEAAAALREHGGDDLAAVGAYYPTIRETADVGKALAQLHRRLSAMAEEGGATTEEAQERIAHALELAEAAMAE